MRALALLAPLLLLGCLEASPVEFEIENATGQDLFLQEDAPEAEKPAWLRLFGADDVPFRFSSAGACACACSDGPGCFVECAALRSSAAQLADGSVASFSWDGLERRVSSCVDERPVPGELLSVEACAGPELIVDPRNDGDLVADTTERCERVDFARDAGVVRIVLE